MPNDNSPLKKKRAKRGKNKFHLCQFSMEDFAQRIEKLIEYDLRKYTVLCCQRDVVSVLKTDYYMSCFDSPEYSWWVYTAWLELSPCLPLLPLARFFDYWVLRHRKQMKIEKVHFVKKQPATSPRVALLRTGGNPWNWKQVHDLYESNHCELHTHMNLNSKGNQSYIAFSSIS